MGKKSNNNLSETIEVIEFVKAAKNQAPNMKNELIMSLLNEAEKNFMDRLYELLRSKSPKKE
jgi:hypothetical protein